MATKRELEILDRNIDLLMGEILESTPRCTATMKTLLTKYRKSIYTHIEQTHEIEKNQLTIDTYANKKIISGADYLNLTKYIGARKTQEKLIIVIKQIERELQELPSIKTSGTKERRDELIQRKGQYEIQLYDIIPAIKGYKDALKKSNTNINVIFECLACAETIVSTTIKRDKVTDEEQKRYEKDIKDILEANKQELITKITRPYKANASLYQQKLQQAKATGTNLENNVNNYKKLCQQSELVRFEVTTRAERRAAHKDVNEIDEPIA